MAQVIATSKHGRLQNSHGGVRFFQSAVGKISEEITEEQADQFCEMPDHFMRYSGETVEGPKKAEPVKRASPTPAAAGKAAAPDNAQQPNF